jgi:hypothetical protein
LSDFLLKACFEEIAFRAGHGPRRFVVAFSAETEPPDRRHAFKNAPIALECHLMIQLSRDNKLNSIARQPIALAGAALIVLLAGAATIGLWRAYSGSVPELDRAVIARQLQARTAQASEQLVEKTKGLEVTQQESIDQLQVMQDQLSTVRHLLATQQAETRRLSEQVSGLTEAIDGLKQSFASAQPSEPSSPPAARNRSLRTRAHALRTGHQKRANARG